MLSGPAATLSSLHARLWKRWSIVPLRVARLPTLLAAICFGLGIVQGEYFWLPVGILIAVLFLLLVLSIVALRLGNRVVLLPVFAIWIVAGHLCAQLEPRPASQAQLAFYADNLSRQVHGKVVRIEPLPLRSLNPSDVDPETIDHEQPQQPVAVIDLQLDQIESVTPETSQMLPIDGGVRLYLLASMPVLNCGDIITASLQLREPERYRDPGVWQYADYLQEAGIGATARIEGSKLNIASSERALSCRIHAASTWASRRLHNFVDSEANQHLPPMLRLNAEDAAMLTAMLFGDRAELTQNLRTSFERTGTFHIFVVAGMHLALLAAILYGLLRVLRISEGWRVLITLGLSAAYAVFTGFGPPVQRALGMTAVFLIMRWLSRDRNILNALGCAALGVMIAAPHLLLQASLQMTLLVVFAIGGLAVPIIDRTFGPYLRAAAQVQFIALDTGFTPRLAQFRVLLRMFGQRSGWLLGRWARPLPAFGIRLALRLAELSVISLVAELIMALPMATYFHRLTLFAVPVNLLAIPLLGLLMPCAIFTFCCGFLCAPLAVPPAAATVILLHAITSITHRASEFSFADLRMPVPPMFVIVVVLFVWSLTVWLLRRPSRVGHLVSYALLVIAMALIIWPYKPSYVPNAVELTAIDVGQGDSLLLTSPNGDTMLIDAGGPVGSPMAVADNRWDVGEDVVSPYLWSRGIRGLDIVVLTHAHSDHMGGMPAILRNFHPRELWVSVDANSASFHALLQQARDLGVKIRFLREGNTMAWAGTQIKAIAPTRMYVSNTSPSNNDSLVLEVDYGKSSILLEGDAESQSEATMLASHELHPITLLKVGHHGSNTSTNDAFLRAVLPQQAIVSVGRNNHFGHPREEVLQRLQTAHALTQRTDLNGATTYLVDAQGTVIFRSP